MKCSRCGAELSEDSKFCSYCGNKIETPLKPGDAPKENVPPMPSDEPARNAQSQKEAAKSSDNKRKEKTSSQRGKLSTYSKIATVAISIFILLFVAALLSGKTAALMIAVLQIVLSVVAVLMHRGVIKLKQKQPWLKWLLLGIAALFTVLNVMSYSWDSKVKDRPTANSISSVATVSVTAPYEAAECIGQDYSMIQSAFSSAGFTNIKTEKVENLQVTDADRVNTIDSISIDGNTDFAKDQEFKSDVEVLIRYHGYAKCTVKVHIDFVPNLIFSKYDVNLLLDGVEKGTLTHGEDQDFEFSLDPGKYTLTFESAESSSVKGEVALTVDCDVEASYKISCYSDKVAIETMYVDRLAELADGEVKLDVSASEYRHKNYEDVAAALKTLGFTNIKYEILYDIVLGWTHDGEVENVSIAGKTDFTRGNVFPADAETIITYHMPEDSDPNKTSKDSDSNEPTQNKPAQSDNSDLSNSSNLTVENCPELAAMLTNKAEIDESYSAFASKYRDRIIEFDGRIDNCMKHGKYNTRFDYLVSAGDYDPDHQIGPAFKFENVCYSDLNTNLDTVSVGLNVHIIAVVKSFNTSNELFYLDPVSVTGR